MSHREPVTVGSAEEPTIGKLVVDATNDISTLVQHEIQLAKAELKVSVRAGGISIALFAAAGFLGLLAIIMLSIAIAYLIHLTGLNLAWCYLIVVALYVLVAAILALVGVKLIKKVSPPKRAIAHAQKTKDALKRG